jgi:hypothetical protein
MFYHCLRNRSSIFFGHNFASVWKKTTIPRHWPLVPKNGKTTKAVLKQWGLQRFSYAIGHDWRSPFPDTPNIIVLATYSITINYSNYIYVYVFIYIYTSQNIAMKLLVLDWIAHADIITRMRERGKQNTTTDIGLGSQCKIFVETVGVQKIRRMSPFPQRCWNLESESYKPMLLVHM